MKKLLGLGLLLLAGCNQSPQQLSNNEHRIVLFDEGHGQTAGEADWVIDGAFSDFADDIKKTSTIHTTLVLTDDALKDASVVVLPEPNIPYTTTEQQALKQYVEQGGSVMMIADHYNADRNFNRFDSSEIFNGYRRGAYKDITKGMTESERQSARIKNVSSSDFLSETFGVRFRYNAINNVTLTDMDNEFNITDGVKRVNMHAGSTLMITNPNIAKGIVYLPKLNSHDKWKHAVDEGIYNGGGRNEGPFIAISQVGRGKAVFIGDSSIVEDATPKYKREDNGQSKETYDGYKEADHSKLLMNLMDWLQSDEQGDYSKKDQVTPIRNFELPQQSTEPKEEPWATAKYGYLWYDPSTFANGSFINRKDPVQQNESEKKITKQETDKRKTNLNNHTTNNQNGITIDSTRLSATDYFTINVYTNKRVNIKIELISDGVQVGLFNGRPPGVSNEYVTKQDGERYMSYFKGRLAREANKDVLIRVIENNEVKAEFTEQVH